MNFRAVATEIMLTANEEKWYETRDRIEEALKVARYAGIVERDRDCPADQRRYGVYITANDGGWTEAVDAARERQAYEPNSLWRDQPDGVR